MTNYQALWAAPVVDHICKMPNLCVEPRISGICHREARCDLEPFGRGGYRLVSDRLFHAEELLSDHRPFRFPSFGRMITSQSGIVRIIWLLGLANTSALQNPRNPIIRQIRVQTDSLPLAPGVIRGEVGRPDSTTPADGLLPAVPVPRFTDCSLDAVPVASHLHGG